MYIYHSTDAHHWNCTKRITHHRNNKNVLIEYSNLLYPSFKLNKKKIHSSATSGILNYVLSSSRWELFLNSMIKCVCSPHIQIWNLFGFSPFTHIFLFEEYRISEFFMVRSVSDGFMNKTPFASVNKGLSKPS